MLRAPFQKGKWLRLKAGHLYEILAFSDIMHVGFPGSGSGYDRWPEHTLLPEKTPAIYCSRESEDDVEG